jgi:predicted GNAT superfamily acetyltransferase
LRDNMTPINYTSTEFKWFHKTYSKFILQDG